MSARGLAVAAALTVLVTRQASAQAPPEPPPAYGTSSLPIAAGSPTSVAAGAPTAAPLPGDHVAPQWKRSLAVEGHLSIGGPVGVGGVMIAYEPVPWLVLPIGVGAGFAGPQLAFVPRLRWVWSDSIAALSAGAGLSGGPYDSFTNAFSGLSSRHWDRALWLDLSASLELRWSVGMSLRFYAGMGSLLNPSEGTCDFTCEPVQQQIPYFGLAAGYAFAP